MWVLRHRHDLPVLVIAVTWIFTVVVEPVFEKPAAVRSGLEIRLAETGHWGTGLIGEAVCQWLLKEW